MANEEDIRQERSRDVANRRARNLIFPVMCAPPSAPDNAVAVSGPTPRSVSGRCATGSSLACRATPSSCSATRSSRRCKSSRSRAN